MGLGCYLLKVTSQGMMSKSESFALSTSQSPFVLLSVPPWHTTLFTEINVSPLQPSSLKILWETIIHNSLCMVYAEGIFQLV